MTKFQEFMDRHQLTQYRLHKITGFSKSQISEWQRGIHLPSAKSVHRIAFKLRLPLRDVLAMLDTRENYQNYRTPEGTFVARTKENFSASRQTKDTTRIGETFCLSCKQLISKAA